MAIQTLEYNKELYKSDEWQWQEGDLTATRSASWSGPGCHEGCSVIYYTDKDGNLVNVEGDPNSPFNRGRLCLRCLNYKQHINSPDRLKYPMKRAGERGENKWERISWDEALDIIDDNVKRIQKDYGPESICCMMGTGRNACWQVPLICYWGFGSPNFALGFLSGDSCMLPRVSLNFAQNGGSVIADMSQSRATRYEDDPEWKCPEIILIWANNPVVSNSDAFLGHWIVDAMQRGSELIVVDPKLTWLASRAKVWLRLRPGTDAALALAFANVIIEEGLYDYEFVNLWSYGFDEYAAAAAEWTPERAAEVCWVDADDIRKAARMYATAKPAALQWGLPLDQSQIGIPSAQAVNSLVALTGNLDVPGGNIITDQPYHTDMAYNCGLEDLPDEVRAKRIGDDASPLHTYGYASSAMGDMLLHAMETEEPYPIKMLWMQTTNPIANMGAEAPRVYRAIRKMDFVVVVDLFMTPTAVGCADLVLPAAMSPERNCIRTWYTPIRAITKVKEPPGEAKSDEDIALAVIKKCNPEILERFGITDDISLLNFFLKNRSDWGRDLGKDFDDLKHCVLNYPDFQYKKYEKGLCRPDGSVGFMTPTGRFEFSITCFEQWGLPSVPYYQEPPESPYSTPELFEEYPLVLTTGARMWQFFHSEHRNFPNMREIQKDPQVRVNSKTAEKYGTKEGDWVWIENFRGRCRQKLVYDDTLDERVIAADHGWWFPEEEPAEPHLFGVFDSNINNLTSQMQYGSTGYGAPYKCTICKIYKCTEENSQELPGDVVTRKGGWKYEEAQPIKYDIHNADQMNGREQSAQIYKREK
ncbi:MAG: molybdopterin-dependent oxidoreductase [Coriobacteriales bacterium]|jgi:anaerobic selenocysteine-containing dehydrogenase